MTIYRTTRNFNTSVLLQVEAATRAEAEEKFSRCDATIVDVASEQGDYEPEFDVEEAPPQPALDDD